MAMHLNDRMFETHLSTPTVSVRHSLSLQVTAILQKDRRRILQPYYGPLISAAVSADARVRPAPPPPPRTRAGEAAAAEAAADNVARRGAAWLGLTAPGACAFHDGTWNLSIAARVWCTALRCVLARCTRALWHVALPSLPVAQASTQPASHPAA
jgi:hypothetical protein